MLIFILMWIAGLLSLALLGSGGYLIWAWYTGAVVGTAYLVGGLALLIFSLIGRPLVLLLLRRPGPDEPKMIRNGLAQRVQRPDGSELHVEFYGPPDGQPLILTHGWGQNSTEWYYMKQHLTKRFRLIVWDLPGLGKSRKPANNDYHLEKMARDLEAVLALAEDKPAILLGHSIGGMITLTFCRLFPQHLGSRVAGLILVHTTYTNPLKTTLFNDFFRAIQQPVLVPFMYLNIGLSPLFWLMNWLSYFNGLGHLVMALTGFAGTETRGQLDFITHFFPLASPAVQARGMLGMFQFDETETLDRIKLPVLVISGDHDIITLPEASQHIHEEITTSEHVGLSPAGHMGLIEQHKQFEEAVGTFNTNIADLEQLQARQPLP